MTPEARFSARVKSGLVHCDIERVENRVNLGVPDMMIGVGERFVLVELKVVSKGLKVGLRPHQIAFMTRHAAKCRPCFVLVHDMGNTLRPSTIRLYHGRDAMALATEGIKLEPLRCWPSRGMPWKELEETLGLVK
jgi:hypothetical protein